MYIDRVPPGKGGEASFAPQPDILVQFGPVQIAYPEQLHGAVGTRYLRGFTTGCGGLLLTLHRASDDSDLAKLAGLGLPNSVASRALLEGLARPLILAARDRSANRLFADYLRAHGAYFASRWHGPRSGIAIWAMTRSEPANEPGARGHHGRRFTHALTWPVNSSAERMIWEWADAAGRLHKAATNT